MVGLGRHSKTEIECPFCHKGKVMMHHTEGCLQGRKSSIAAGSKITYHMRPDKYKVQSKCPNCGKTAKEIEKALETGITKELTHEERLKRLKEAGLPTKIESKRRN